MFTGCRTCHPFPVGCREWLIFKGATSLSKGFNIIERFSEDIDLAISHSFFGIEKSNKSRRWDLKRYHCTDEDIAFAESFISWNDIKNGIQRVDACRTRDGRLLLIELEDLNPYLSLLELDEKTRETFVADMVNALKKYLL